MVRHVKRACTISLAFVLLAMVGADVWAMGPSERGSTREVMGFDRVSLEIPRQLILTQGNEESLEIEASEDDLSRIVTSVWMGILHLGQREPSRPPEAARPIASP